MLLRSHSLSISLATLVSVLAACGTSTPPAPKTHTDKPKPFVTASHEDLPEVVTFGGPVLAHPNVVAVYLEGDPQQPDVDALLPQLQSTGYWSAVTSEYGVGDLTVQPSIVLPAITDTLDSRTLAHSLAQVLPNPALSTIYMFMIPATASFVDDSGACCVQFDGFHEDKRVNGVDVPLAFVCGGCAGADGPNVTAVDEASITLSHELAEASTDPFPFTNPAFAGTDDNHVVWQFLTGGEDADMCEFLADVKVSFPGVAHPFQRTWSNANAKKGLEPCVPVPTGEVFFASIPVLDDDVALAGGFHTKGALIGVGETKTVDVQLYSEAAHEPWGVNVIEGNAFFGGEPHLKLEPDTTFGENGDVIHVDVTVLSPDPSLGAELFIVESQFNHSSSMSLGLIGQP